jgi:hypothetical protein
VLQGWNKRTGQSVNPVTTPLVCNQDDFQREYRGNGLALYAMSPGGVPWGASREFGLAWGDQLTDMPFIHGERLLQESGLIVGIRRTVGVEWLSLRR